MVSFQKRTYFILGDLKPSSLYFIQVQAVTVPYGLKKKLFSEKAVVFIDTNKYKNGELYQCIQHVVEVYYYSLFKLL